MPTPIVAVVYRIQDLDGRGPWKPGFSQLWIRERQDHENLRPWMEQFGRGILPNHGWPFGQHFGCACRTLDQLRRWFTAEEYETLQEYGYQAVAIGVHRILAENDIQLVFQRASPLRAYVEPVALYAPRSTSSTPVSSGCNHSGD